MQGLGGFFHARKGDFSKMKAQMIILILVGLVSSQTLTVRPLNPVGIDDQQARAITTRLQIELANYAQIVDRTNLDDVMAEHGLRQSGAIQGASEDSIAIQGADRLVTGSVGTTGCPGTWFLETNLVDVNSTRVLASQRITTQTGLEGCLAACRPMARALMTGESIESDPKVSIQQDNRPLILGTDKLIIEHHVYEHKPDTTPMPKQFLPCRYCGGTHKMPCRTCPEGTKDCMHCSITSQYKGPETGGEFLTGHWETTR